MTTVTLHRNPPKGKAVTGTIRIPIGDERWDCPTLENADFIIPAGTYPLKRTWSPKFKKNLPILENVPDREGIRIHKGTLPEHSQGCIITDLAGMAYLNVMFNRVAQRKELFDEDEQICIEIFDADPAA